MNKYVAEALGTFVLVFGGVGSAVLAAGIPWFTMFRVAVTSGERIRLPPFKSA